MSHEKIDAARPMQIVSVVGLVMVIAPAKCPVMHDLGRRLPQFNNNIKQLTAMLGAQATGGVFS